MSAPLPRESVALLDQASRKLNAAYKDGQCSILARLDNPDEALVEAVFRALGSVPTNHWDRHKPTKAALSALARTLAEREEGEDG